MECRPLRRQAFHPTLDDRGTPNLAPNRGFVRHRTEDKSHNTNYLCLFRFKELAEETNCNVLSLAQDRTGESAHMDKPYSQCILELRLTAV